MKQLVNQLWQLLNLHSPSGKEQKVAAYLFAHLRSLLDRIWFDDYGNILGERRYGDSGYTVLLSAHMDTVAREQPIPYWKNKQRTVIATRSNSALGGDDKCGLAAHLAIIREMNKQTNFKGTIKVCFSRQEEIGCVGAEKAVAYSPGFFADIDACIVIDRRGGNDVVDGGSWMPFCSDEYTQFWLDMAEKVGFKAQRADGTISDTMIFAELGINGVNLSAGYYHAHTKDEYIKVNELKRTVRWVLTALDNIEQHKFPEFEDKYNVSWTRYYSSKDTVGYCDSCGEIYDLSEMIEDDGYYYCERCLFDDIVVCDNCLRDVYLSNIVEKGESKVCSRCALELAQILS